MRGLTLLIATILTFGYGFAAQAAMTMDRAATYRRAALTVAAPDPTADAMDRTAAHPHHPGRIGWPRCRSGSCTSWHAAGSCSCPPAS